MGFAPLTVWTDKNRVQGVTHIGSESKLNYTSDILRVAFAALTASHSRTGFTPEAAIQAATEVSAMAVGQAAQRGTIASGKAADLVVLSADPTVDVRNVRKIVEVMKDVRVFRPVLKP